MLDEVIRSLREKHQIYFGTDTPPEICVTRTMCPNNSRLARLSLRWGHHEKSVYVKLLYPDQPDGRTNRSDRQYKEEQVQTEFRVLDTLYRRFAQNPDLGVIRPVACFPEYLALVTEEQPGSNLSSFFGNVKIYSPQGRTKQLAHLVFLCGRWLRLFQEYLKEETPPKYDFDEVFSYCEARLTRLAQCRAVDFTERTCRAVRRFLFEIVDGLRKEKLAIVGRHNDFGPINMIVSEGRLLVLDFAGFSYGPNCCDYVKFWSILDSIVGSPLVSVSTVERLQEGFIRGYGERLDAKKPLFAIYRVAWMLDRMEDIWIDEWPTLGWARRPIYQQLYSRYFASLKDYCRF